MHRRLPTARFARPSWHRSRRRTESVDRLRYGGRSFNIAEVRGTWTLRSRTPNGPPARRQDLIIACAAIDHTEASVPQEKRRHGWSPTRSRQWADQRWRGSTQADCPGRRQLRHVMDMCRIGGVGWQPCPLSMSASLMSATSESMINEPPQSRMVWASMLKTKGPPARRQATRAVILVETQDWPDLPAE